MPESIFGLPSETIFTYGLNVVAAKAGIEIPFPQRDVHIYQEATN